MGLESEAVRKRIVVPVELGGLTQRLVRGVRERISGHNRLVTGHETDGLLGANPLANQEARLVNPRASVNKVRSLGTEIRRTPESATIATAAIGGDPWRFGNYNSPISDYDITFRAVLGDHTIGDLLKDSSGCYREGLVVVDLAAPSGTIADLFSEMPPDPTRKGIAVSLTDERTQEEKVRDASLGITQLPLNLGELRSFDEIEDQLGGLKADIVMSRAIGGLDDLPQSSFYYVYAAQRSWEFLKKKVGNLVAQVPKKGRLELPVQAWGHLLETQGIEAHAHAHQAHQYSTIRVVKSPNAPERLPFL